MFGVWDAPGGPILIGTVASAVLTAFRAQVFRNPAGIPFSKWGRRRVAAMGLATFVGLWFLISLGTVPRLSDSPSAQMLMAAALPLGFKFLRDLLVRLNMQAIPVLTHLAQLLDELTTTAFVKAISEERAFLSGNCGNSEDEKVAIHHLFHRHLEGVVRGSLRRIERERLEDFLGNKQKRDKLPQAKWHKVRDTQAQIRHLLEYHLSADEFSRQYQQACSEQAQGGLPPTVPRPVDLASIIHEVLHAPG